MEILMWIIAAIAAMGFIVFFSTLAEFIYYSCFTEKRFNIFLQEIKQDPLIKALLKEINSQNIKLAPFGLFHEFLFHRKTAMTAIPMQIAISNKKIKRFLNDKRTRKSILLGLTHELGHLNQFFLEEYIKKICKYERYCLYSELRATKQGCRLLEKISGKEIREIFTKHLLNSLILTSREQCEKCISQGILENKCPKIEELKKMGIKVDKNNKKIYVWYSIFIKPPKKSGFLSKTTSFARGKLVVNLEESPCGNTHYLDISKSKLMCQPFSNHLARFSKILQPVERGPG